MASRSHAPDHADIYSHRKFLIGPGLRGYYLPTSYVSELTGISIRRLAYIRAQGKGPSVIREGHYYLYPAQGVVDWLNEVDCCYEHVRDA